MINEIVLEFAALLLALFCLIEFVRQCREPLPKGPGAVIRDRRAVYAAALCALAVSAAASLAEKLGTVFKHCEKYGIKFEKPCKIRQMKPYFHWDSSLL